MPDQIPKPVVQERYERLVALVDDIAWAENKNLLGKTVEVMFADNEGRKDDRTARMSGRARDHRLVHVAVPTEADLRPRPGDMAKVVIDYAAPHHLTADGGLHDLRRTRGGDAWQQRRAKPAPGVSLGMPALRSR